MQVDRTGDDEHDDRTNTARHVAILERWVRQYPASYLWLHRRWKTQPAVTPPSQPSLQPEARP
ncbi:MAG: hypothetical protein HY303_03915 [Candidatus Wallbacteria bacterium]|nr:hypothetical protein [Candidatus Wallbacteria bacterium]